MVFDLYIVGRGHDNNNVPKPLQNRTLWTIVILLREKTIGYGISFALQADLN